MNTVLASASCRLENLLRTISVIVPFLVTRHRRTRRAIENAHGTNLVLNTSDQCNTIANIYAARHFLVRRSTRRAFCKGRIYVDHIERISIQHPFSSPFAIEQISTMLSTYVYVLSLSSTSFSASRELVMIEAYN